MIEMKFIYKWTRHKKRKTKQKLLYNKNTNKNKNKKKVNYQDIHTAVCIGSEVQLQFQILLQKSCVKSKIKLSTVVHHTQEQMRQISGTKKKLKFYKN